MTESMTAYNTGDVVILPFPFSDFASSKQRPALVVSSRYWNSTRDDVIIVVISSKISQSEFEYVLNEREQKVGGLRLLSAVRFGNIFTVDKRLVREKIGSFSRRTVRAIQSGIHKIISV